MNADRQVIKDYFREVEATQERLRASKATDSKLRLMAKNAVPARLRSQARQLITDAVRPVQRRKADAIAAASENLKLHLGSGGEPKDGWINIDFVGDPVEVAWDLAYGVPFDDATVDAVFHEHLLEHIPLEAGLGLMDECFRVLKPGGILRVGVPNAGALLRSYGGDGAHLDEIHPGRPSRMIAVQELFYWHRHRAMYDDETLGLLFRAGGFPEPARREFGETELEAAPDTLRRRAETLYMEAVKPL